MWTHEMFGVEKPVIALLHLDALPGDPGFCGSMDTVLDHARQDLAALQNGGVDGILLCTMNADSKGNADMSASDLPAGIYLVKAGDVSYKIMKR